MGKYALKSESMEKNAIRKIQKWIEDTSNINLHQRCHYQEENFKTSKTSNLNADNCTNVSADIRNQIIMLAVT